MCREDEQLWANILARADNSFARIVDCRPFKNALGNKAKGFGYEDEARYQNTSISFYNIQNIHVMRSSMEKLLALICAPSSSSSSSGGAPGYSWLGSIENTGWLNHVRTVLNASITVARFVGSNGFPVLIHCSDGWDRTSQVSAVAQVLLDSYFRTIDGFQVLIEKDWLSFGYQFMARTGHGTDTGSDDRSPCFLQFIDCVWQLYNQFPTLFEFNEEYLICILDHLYSCKFGTFFCDCEGERQKNKLSEKTASLWDYIQSQRARFLNPFYTPMPENVPVLPHPSAVNRQVCLWSSYYLRYSSVPSLNSHAFVYLNRPELRFSLMDSKEVLKMAILQAQDKIDRLEKRIVSLRSSVTSLTMGTTEKEEEEEDQDKQPL